MTLRTLGTALALALISSSAVQGTRNLHQSMGQSTSSQDILSASPDSSDYGYYLYYDYSDDSGDDCAAPLDIVASLNQSDNLNYFIDAVSNTGIAELLVSNSSAVTVFAPTDKAFEEAAATLNVSISDLLESPVLLPVLLYHIVPYSFQTSELTGSTLLPTALGQTLIITPDFSVPPDMYNSTKANLTATESTANLIDSDECGCDSCDTVVHVIDGVLLPQILAVKAVGEDTLIILSDGSGLPTQNFLIDYNSASPSASPSAAPSGSLSWTAAAPTGTLESLGGGSLRG